MIGAWYILFVNLNHRGHAVYFRILFYHSRQIFILTNPPRHMLNLTRFATTTAPIIARGVGATAPSSVAAAVIRCWNLAGLLEPSPLGVWPQRRFASLTTGVPDLRDVQFCLSNKSARYRPLKNIVPGVHLDDILSSTARQMEATINDPITTDFWVPRRVACGLPTALEERDGMYWPMEMPLHELIREHGITPNSSGEIFVLAGPPRIGDRAYS